MLLQLRLPKRANHPLTGVHGDSAHGSSPHGRQLSCAVLPKEVGRVGEVGVMKQAGALEATCEHPIRVTTMEQPEADSNQIAIRWQPDSDQIAIRWQVDSDQLAIMW